MAASTFLFSLIIVRYLTVPLTRVARAAERFGQDLSAPPLPEVGAAEARAVARAFNEMNRRIRQFVEDRTRMIAAISHDLRTPITLLRLRTEFITDPDERARMRATLAEMEGMIAATLAFARDDAADEPRLRVDLAALLSSICYDMADAGLPVRFEPESKVSLECRPGALRRALTNLLDNSVKYGGGARVSLAESEREIRILIDDDGPGIAEAEQEAVFRPFYRLEPSRNREFGGVGLGLSVARTIIHGHGGAITLANRPEGGLRVTLTLPLNPNTG
ncbi:MAG: HAMP domain-containing protein [Azospirillum sp.]|nr:HAMP domain-containing protein [Azospirillum sp.]